MCRVLDCCNRVSDSTVVLRVSVVHRASDCGTSDASDTHRVSETQGVREPTNRCHRIHDCGVWGARLWYIGRQTAVHRMSVTHRGSQRAY